MEIEKSLSKDAVSGKSDSGTSSRSFGTLLSWLNDHKTPVFVIGTSNNHTLLPAEFTRKGRFDECFFIDLPTVGERAEIFSVILKRYKRDPQKFKSAELATLSDGFTGSEIENVIVSAMFSCFSDEGKDINMTALKDTISDTIPLSQTRAEDFAEIRKEAQGKLRIATENGLIAAGKNRKIEV